MLGGFNSLTGLIGFFFHGNDMASSSDLPGTGDRLECASEAMDLLCMPDPVLYRIVRELCPDALDLVRVSLACKALQRACDDVSIWQHVLELRFGENILPAPEQPGKPRMKCDSTATTCHLVEAGSSCQFQLFPDRSMRTLGRCKANKYLLTTAAMRTCVWYP